MRFPFALAALSFFVSTSVNAQVNITLSPYGPVRRVVTGTTPDNTSVVLSDKRLEAFGNETIAQTGLFWTDTIPANNSVGEFEDLVLQHPEDVASPNGTHYFVLDFAPGTSFPFHQTLSLDFGVITKGNMTLTLTSGEKVYLGPGDAIINRGIVHGWANEGEEWVRMYFSLTPASEVKV